jgi:hypothetical protein
MKKSILLYLAILLLSISLNFAQHTGTNNAGSDQDPSTIKGVKSGTASLTPKVIEAEQFSISQPLRDMVSASTISTNAEKRKSDRKKIDYPDKETALPKGPDNAWQKEMGTSSVKWNPTTNFYGIFEGEYGGSYGTPPDTQGDVGPNHYFQVVNTSYKIWDKEGNSLVGPLPLSTIWSVFSPGPLSDPIVLYDEIADRWFVSIFEKDSPHRVFIAVSTSPDPTHSFYLWSYPWDGQPDYAKYGIWRDGYYFGYNNGTCVYDVGVYDRSAMIAGNTNPAVVSFDNPHSTYGYCILPFDNDGDFALSGKSGQFIHFYDDAWPASITDQLWIYTLSVNWSNPLSSTFARTQTINVTPFDSDMGPYSVGVSQPGTTQKLATVSNQMMYRAQYRKFDTHETIVCCHTVDVDNTDHAGIRWYELRRTSGNWWVYQESTYAPDANSRFMASIAMNGLGDMALGYSVASSAVYPSIRYTGRKVSDPLNIMAIPEGEIVKGYYSQTGIDRWGDYSCMSVDPSDDTHFWYTNEFRGNSGWLTRIAKIGMDDPVYCSASGGCDEFISLVQFGTIYKGSICSGYADYTDLSTSFPANGSEQITVTNGPPNYGADECGIWVDWNQDGDFYDANESIAVGGSPGIGPYTATIAPPSGAALGFYRLRIRIKYTSGLDPCGTTTYGEVEDYSFELTPKVANEWTGASNSYWNQAANWSLGHKPTPDENVIINNVGYQPPIIAFTDEECNNLTINTGAGVYVMGNTLTTNGNMTIFGQLSMVDDNGGIICHGNVDWNNTSTANFTANSLFQVYGHWFFNSGANAQLNNGTVNFIGNNLSEVKSKSATCSFNNIYINKNYNALKIISDANQPLVINGDIGIQSNSGFTNDSQQDIICRGNFYNSGYYYLSDVNKLSTFIFDGSNQYIFMFSANGYFNHLKISPTVSVILGGSIHTSGDLIIESGTLDAQSNTIIVEGDWANNVGPDAFIESTGRVIFSGTNIQYCSDEVFNILEIDNPPGAVYISGTYVICTAYDWTAGTIDVFNNGVFSANDLIDNGIYGKFVLNDNSTINLINYDGYVDLNGELYINGGTMNVYGGTTPSYWPYAADAVINMSGGVLDFHDQGIYVFDTPTYSLTDNFLGGTVKTSQGYLGERADFTPTGGTFEFYGPDDYYIFQSNGSTLFNVNINKSGGKGSSLPPGIPVIDQRSKKLLSDGGKSNTSILGSDIVITRDLYIANGELKLDGHTLTVIHNCDVYGMLTLDNSADVLITGQDFSNSITFITGSTANLLAGTIYNYGWVHPGYGCTFNASTNNTIVCKGGTGGGLSNNEPSATYGNVVIDKNANQITYINGSSSEAIVVNGSFTVNPDNIFEMQDNTMIVHGSFTDSPSSEIYAYKTTKSNEAIASLKQEKSSSGSKAKGGILEIDSDFTLKGLLDVGSDGNVLINGKFGSADNSTILISGGSVISGGPEHLDWESYMGNLTLSSGLFEVTNNSILFNQYSTTNVSGGVIRCGGAFHASFGDAPGIFAPTGGVVEFISTSGFYFIYCPVGNNFYDLRLNCYGSTMSFHDSPDVLVLNDVILDAGFLQQGNISNSIIRVGGDWVENEFGFSASSGTVSFFGLNPSQITGSPYFFNLDIDKIYTGINGVNINDGQYVTVINNLNCNTGGLSLGNSAIDINNDLSIQLDAIFEVQPSKTAAINVKGNWTNGNTANTSTTGFFPGMSTVTFNGIADQYLNSNAGVEGFYEFALDNGPNVLYNYTDIECIGDFHAYSGNMVDDYGGTSNGHNFYSDFIIEQNTNVDFDSHILGFFGSNDATFWDVSGNSLNSSNYGATIYINKDDPATLMNFMGDNTTGLNIGSSIIVYQGYVTPLVSLTCTGGIIVNSGTLHLGEEKTLSIDGDIEVNFGASFEILGSTLNPVTIKNALTGGYSIDVKYGGIIRAENVIFEGMELTGIFIQNDSWIDPEYSFTNCTFRDFINPGPSSAFLTINNNQVLTISDASFPDNSSAAYNIRKNNDQGQITLFDYSGVFVGETYEDDPFNRVDWIVPTFQLDLKVFLEGPFNGTDMNAELNNLSMIPLTQPYNAAPWNYLGTESVAAIPSNQVVDWVLIEGRDAPDAASATEPTSFERQAAFLLDNGSIVGLDGSSLLSCNYVLNNDLFVIIWHRNHLPVMSANPLTESGGVYSYDFTTSEDQAHNSGQKNLGGGNFGMVAADGDADGSIDNDDDFPVWANGAGNWGYLPGDYNLDNQVDNKDKNDFWFPNEGIGSQVPE